MRILFLGDVVGRSGRHALRDHLPDAIKNNNIDLEYLYSLNLKEARNIFEHDYIEKNLDRFNGNVSKTANFIGMERSAFHRKLNILKKIRKQN